MKGIVHAIIVYTVAVAIYKICGDINNIEHVNYYWIVSASVFAYIFLKLSMFLNLSYFKDKYLKEDISLYKWVLRSFSIYWIVMLSMRVYVAFDLSLYDKIISKGIVRDICVGALCLVFVYLLLIFKVLHQKYDAEK